MASKVLNSSHRSTLTINQISDHIICEQMLDFLGYKCFFSLYALYHISLLIRLLVSLVLRTSACSRLACFQDEQIQR